jgi:hypothetical protein
MPVRTSRLLIALAIVVALQPINTGARATLPTGNLLLNGGAEAPVGSDGSQVVGPTGWMTDGTAFSAVSYDAGGGYPDRGFSDFQAGGNNMFAGSPDAGQPVTFAHQTVTLTGDALDAARTGIAKMSLSGVLGGFGSEDDRMNLSAIVRDKDGSQLQVVTLLGPTSADRKATTYFLWRGTSFVVHKRARTIEVYLAATREVTDGANTSRNDGYADNIRLEFGRPRIRAGASIEPTSPKYILFDVGPELIDECGERRVTLYRARPGEDLKLASKMTATDAGFPLSTIADQPPGSVYYVRIGPAKTVKAICLQGRSGDLTY